MDTAVLNKAIAAHGQWKIKLKDAIEGRGAPLDPANIGRDSVCEFGQWLATVQPKPSEAAQVTSVRQLHADFHRAAADVARLAAVHKKAEAESSMNVGGRYFEASANLVSALMTWKKTAA